MRDGTSNLAHHQPESDRFPRTAQVLQFRPRERSSERGLGKSADQPGESAGGESEFDDLAQFEQDRKEEDEPVNYHQRMLMNVIALAVVAVLIGVGVWLADTIAEMELNQDCVLQGRQNCATIEVPGPVQH
jgi:hypothetical protein